MNVYIVFNNKNQEYNFWLSFLKRSYYLVLMLTALSCKPGGSSISLAWIMPVCIIVVGPPNALSKPKSVFGRKFSSKILNLEKKYSSYIDSLQHVISGLVWFMVFNAPFNNIISVIYRGGQF
jgi:hypothetical protein